MNFFDSCAGSIKRELETELQNILTKFLDVLEKFLAGTIRDEIIRMSNSTGLYRSLPNCEIASDKPLSAQEFLFQWNTVYFGYLFF